MNTLSPSLEDASASIIVPVRNAGSDIHGLLDCIARQTFPRDRLEVVFGDDGSTDGSLDDVAGTGLSIRIVPCRPDNAYSARNAAVAASAGKILAFCDADCRPDPQWLEAGISALEGADLVAGFVRPRLPSDRTLWSLADLDIFLDQERNVRSGTAVTANLFVSRAMFDSVGGFDESLPGYGDYSFVQACVAVGGRLAFSRSAAVTHPTRNGWRELLGKVWQMHRSYAISQARAGLRPDGLKLRNWIPLIQPMRGRRRFKRPLGLDSRRLADAETAPRFAERLAVLPILYILVPYTGGLGQLDGWLTVRRHRRRGAEGRTG